MVSAPGLALAAVMASRSDSWPSLASTTSSGVVTVKVAGTRRASSNSTPGRHIRSGRRLDPRPGRPRGGDLLVPPSRAWTEENHITTAPFLIEADEKSRKIFLLM